MNLKKSLALVLVCVPASLALAHFTFPLDVIWGTIEYQQRTLAAGDISVERLTMAYLERIQLVDMEGPALNSVLVISPDALDQARAVDAASSDGLALKGAVLLVKDNIDMAGLATTAGSLALANNVVQSDAPVLARLRDAGAVFLGKTNLSEWANFRSTRSISGWSSVAGQTVNPHVLNRSPCGSSAGSGAAVAAGLASAALGTETDGSVTCPAAVNGIVGFKPTVGLVSRTGIVPISVSQDTAGPMTRSVQDAALLMSVMAGRDDADPATQAIPADFDFDFSAQLSSEALAGKRLGVIAGYTHGHPDMERLLANARQVLELAGATLVDVEMPGDDYGEDEYRVLLVEFKAGLNAYLAAHAREGQAASLSELIDFNTEHAGVVMPLFGQEIFIRAQAESGLDDPEYLAARARSLRLAGAEGIDALMAEHKLDGLIAPTWDPSWIIDPVNGDSGNGGPGGAPAVAGYPHLTVPMGMIRGLPVGLSFIGGRFQDASILGMGYAFEIRTHAASRPVFLPEVPFR
ncbi:MAG: amidase [Gammaproteobacteria bacterium]|nr:amidase [Gammaproteobacteria bacterium]